MGTNCPKRHNCFDFYLNEQSIRPDCFCESSRKFYAAKKGVREILLHELVPHIVVMNEYCRR